MRSYEPVVDCEPRPPAAPSEESCSAALASMPAYHKEMNFGTAGDWRTSPGSLPRVINACEYSWLLQSPRGFDIYILPWSSYLLTFHMSHAVDTEI